MIERTIKNAVIESARITTEEHGCLTMWLSLDYGGAGQGFGGYALYLPKSFKHHGGQGNFAGHFIYRCLEVAGVESFADLPGKTIRVDSQHSKVHRIGHIVKEVWFDPEEELKMLREALGGAHE